MDINEIDCAIEDAWKEFDRTGEITNAADNLLSVVTELRNGVGCNIETGKQTNEIIQEKAELQVLESASAQGMTIGDYIEAKRELIRITKIE